MNKIKAAMAVVFLAATISSNVALAAEAVISKNSLTEGSYCHLKFPAIREETLSSPHPVLKDVSTGDIIDFYGPCDHDPLGKEEIQSQKLEQQHMFERQFSS
jgi:hypothetical protein